MIARAIYKDKLEKLENQPFNFITFDIETEGLNPLNFLYGMVYIRKELFNKIENRITDIEIYKDDKSHLCIFLSNTYKLEKFFKALSRYKVLVYAHNGLKFDFILIKNLLNLKEDKKSLSLKYHNLTFRDSFKLLPLPLKELGKTVGIKKRVARFKDYYSLTELEELLGWNLENEYSVEFLTSAEGKEYCYYDVKILYIALKKLIFKEFKINPYKTYSIASLSYNYYKNK